MFGFNVSLLQNVLSNNVLPIACMEFIFFLFYLFIRFLRFKETSEMFLVDS